MPNAPKTPLRPIRVENDLWREYGEVCEEDGVNRSEDLRSYMKRRIRTRRRKKQKDVEQPGS